MNKRLGAITIVVAAVAAAAGPFASTSNSAPTLPLTVPKSDVCSSGHPGPGSFCEIFFTATGPSPSNLTKAAGTGLEFWNRDSVSHTVVFANGLCTFTLTPGEGASPGAVVNGVSQPKCNHDFLFYVGNYAYTVDGKFPGTVVTKPVPRTVTLTARSHTIRRGTRLTVHGRVSWNNQNPLWGSKQRFRVIVLARHEGRHRLEPIATVGVRWGLGKGTKIGWIRYGWKLNVQPGVTTTYIAEVTTQFPPAHGQIWTNARSRPFTVRVPAATRARRGSARRGSARLVAKESS